MQGSKLSHCPVAAVAGCGVRSDRWTGKKNGYPLPCLDAFTLLLDPTVHITENNRICEQCYNIRRRPKSDAGGRTRIIPPPPPDTLLELLAAAIPSSTSGGWRTRCRCAPRT